MADEQHVNNDVIEDAREEANEINKVYRLPCILQECCGTLVFLYVR